MAYNYYPNYLYQQQYQQPTQQIQSGFVSVRSIEEAYNYPVAPGNSVTFRVENTPYVCTKTKGFSPLDQPVFERYRLVKEEAPQNTPEQPVEAFDAEDEINALWDEINALKASLKKGKGHDKSADDSKVSPVRKQSRSIPEPDGNTSADAE